MVIPSGEPRLRAEKPLASGRDRLEMCVAALEDLPDSLQEKVSVNDVEITRKGPTYAIETINQLRAFHPRDEFTLILGSDAASKFDQWYRADALKKIVSILVVKRPGEAKSGFEEVSIKALDISATVIRDALAEKKSVAQFISPSVLTYIKEHKLYGSK
jgi:nicotinate-nucleotide adenylyltransferase